LLVPEIIFDDFHKYGFHLLDIDQLIYERTLSIVENIHNVFKFEPASSCAIWRRSILGYIPDEDRLIEWMRSEHLETVPIFSEHRRRNYASCDLSLYPLELARFGISCDRPACLSGLSNEVDSVLRPLGEFTEDLGRLLLGKIKHGPVPLEGIERPTCSIFRALSYKGGNGNRTSKTHQDYELFTILIQSDPGLEVCGPDGVWRLAPAAKNQAIVLPGEMLEFASGGRIQASQHRVKLLRPRLSAVLFQALKFDILLSKPNFGIAKFGEHLLSRLISGRPDLLEVFERQEFARGLELMRANPFRRGGG
jgi:hypothetical protein